MDASPPVFTAEFCWPGNGAVRVSRGDRATAVVADVVTWGRAARTQSLNAP